MRDATLFATFMAGVFAMAIIQTFFQICAK